MKVVSFEDECPAVGTRWLLVSVAYNERKWLEKRGGAVGEKEDARGFICNSSL